MQELAEGSGRSRAETLELAIKELYDRQFLVAVNKGYAELRANPQAWAEEQTERRTWENTLMDGLDPTERQAEDGTPLPAPSQGQAS